MHGQTLLPGFIEGHSHLLLHPYNETPWNDQVLKESLGLRVARATSHARANLLAGFTTLRDLGTEGAGYADVGLKSAIEKGIIPGPRLLVSTKAIVGSITQRETPLIIPTATADNVMDSKSPWVFRICAGANDYARTTIAFLKANGAPKTMAIVYENTNFGQSNMKAMTAAATTPRSVRWR